MSKIRDATCTLSRIRDNTRVHGNVNLQYAYVQRIREKTRINRN